MIVVTHQIARITFRTESDVLLPHLEKDPFARFRVGDVEPDVRNRIRQLDLDSLTLPPLDGKERECISCSVGFQQRWLEHSVFRSPEVRARLRACLDRPEMLSIDINWNGMTIRDFARSEFDLFYPPEKKERFAGPL
ncbi:MAG: hypothetical protein GTO49_10315, partial [Anaerolineae bacterium]|nr:hypothetical protein [Anaerolineae bacterium]